MADSEFWRKLAEEFRSLPDVCKYLRADRQQIIGQREPQWTLVGTVGAKVNFQTLAMQGATELQSSSSTPLLTVWLEALTKQEGADFRHETIATELNSDGSPRLQRATTSLFALPQTSANLCKSLESDALQVEAEEKRRNDPRNWSALRQQFEAFKGIKKIITGPHETITEAFVRESIARQHGIKPDEVTWKQIQFEVSGLLREYPAITYLPSRPVTSLSEPPPDAPSASKTEQNETAKIVPESLTAQVETIAKQIQKLRLECNWTIEKLAAKTGFDEKTVKRHLSGRMMPRLGNLTVYEQAFSKALNRQVVIEKTPPKRPLNAR